MQLGMIGLGRMGANMVKRLLRSGHEIVAYATEPTAVKAATADGARGVGTLAELVQGLKAPRAVWLMVPAGAVDGMIGQLVPLLSRATSSSTAATRTTTTTSGAPTQLGQVAAPLRGRRHQRRSAGAWSAATA